MGVFRKLNTATKNQRVIKIIRARDRIQTDDGDENDDDR